jgi:hypothetical protein
MTGISCATGIGFTKSTGYWVRRPEANLDLVDIERNGAAGIVLDRKEYSADIRRMHDRMNHEPWHRVAGLSTIASSFAA